MTLKKSVYDSTTTAPLGKVRIVPEPRSALKEWLSSCNGLNVTENVEPTSMETPTLVPLGDMPDVANRNMKYKIDSAIV